ncbi:MAG: cysteine desulfurase family protein [Bacteroidetes bacterium]|nr:cysteine desulfurase family protein [Bacteroidota bacterium]
MKNIYLDYASTTPLDPKVKLLMDSYLTENFGNPSSIHSFGRKSKVDLEIYRQTIAEIIGAEPSEINFTSGGSESDSQAIIGTALASKRKSDKNHLIISSIEHHAVLHSAEYLKNLGFEISIVNVDSNGFVHVDELKKLINSKTLLISIMFVNNETGIIQNIIELGNIAKENKVLFHTDAVQAFGKIKISTKDLPIDIMSISSHKIYGPKGIGVTFIRKGIQVDSLIHGGSQERGKRAGTESLSLIAGFVEAAKICYSQLEKESSQIKKLQNELIKKLNPIIKYIIINSDIKNSIPNILNISFDSQKINIDGESLLLNLDLQGFALSNGSACSSGSIKPSHVLLAMGRSSQTALAALRISIGRFTTIDEIKDFASTLIRIVEKIRK